MNKEMQLYYDYTVSPLGQLFYKTVFMQLESIKAKKVLDFGSGFAFTSNFLAAQNEVIAIEQDKSMIEASNKTNKFKQIHGNLENLKNFSDKSFDLIICHLVLEFVDNEEEILNSLIRLLKDDGILSIVKHNKNGRIIQAIVQDYDIEDANNLLEGGNSFSSAFGDIKYYENTKLLELIKEDMQIISTSGIRVLASLHDAMTQSKENWLEKMYNIEIKLLEQQEFIDIAYFNHLFLKKSFN